MHVEVILPTQKSWWDKVSKSKLNPNSNVQRFELYNKYRDDMIFPYFLSLSFVSCFKRHSIGPRANNCPMIWVASLG